MLETKIEKLTQEVSRLTEAILNMTIHPVSDNKQVAETVAEVAAEIKKPEGPTLDDVRQALRDLAARKGAEAPKKIVTEFGAKKVADLEPDSFDAVIAECKSYE